MVPRIEIRGLLAFVFLLFATMACGFPVSDNPTPEVDQTPSAVFQTTPTESLVVPLPSETVQEEALPTPEFENLSVAYTSENRLYLWSQGSARQLSSSGDAFNPQISPDGQWIAFLRTVDDYHLEIWAVKADGTGERRLVSVADMDLIGGGVRDPASVAINPYRIRWLPNSHILAFNSHQVFQGPGLTLLNDLNLVDVDTSLIQNLFLSGWGGEFTFSPDGKKIVISQPDKIFLANINGSDYRTVLTYDLVTTYSEYRYYATPVWSPDGNFLRVALPPVDPLAQPVQPTEIWEIPAIGSNPVQTGSVNAVPFFEQPVMFSPDLKYLAYIKETGLPEQNQRELYLASSDGTEEWLVAKESPLSFNSWAQDGIHFAYSAGVDRATVIGSVVDSPLSLGPEFTAIQDLQWVGDHQFLFWRAVGNSFEIHLGELGGGSRLLDTTSGSPPVFSFTR